jgi:hypothetical protein
MARSLDVDEASKDDKSSALISGFGFCGYRSFLNEVEILGPLSKVNVVAGRNNSGKSNVLRFAEKLLTGGHFNMEDLDLPDREEGYTARLFLAAGRADSIADGLAAQTTTLDALNPKVLLRRLLTHDSVLRAGMVWVPYRIAGPEGQRSWDIDTEIAEQIGGAIRDMNSALDRISRTITGDGGDPRECVIRLLSHISPIRSLPPIVPVPAFRQITPGDHGVYSNHRGEGLVKSLGRLERPDRNNQRDKKRFAAITRFVRTVLGDHDVRLEIPHGRFKIKGVGASRCDHARRVG